MRQSAYREHKDFKSHLNFLWRRCLSPKYLIYRGKWHWAPRFDHVLKFPTHVDIELNNTCNLRCVMCPHGFDETPAFKASLGYMDFEMAKSIVDEGVSKGMFSCKFNWRGEPLVHRELLTKSIRYAKAKGVRDIQMNTNGLLLNPDYSRELINSGLDRILFSLDGATKESYESIRIGGKFEKLVNNIREFVEIRNSMNVRRPIIRVGMVRMDENSSEASDFVRMWQGVVDYVSITDYTNRGEQDDRLEKTQELIAVGRRPCPQVWQRLIIAFDGKAIICCRDWDSHHVVGNFNRSSVEEIWKGKALETIRQIHRERRLDDMTACRSCKYKESYEWVQASKLKASTVAATAP